MTEPTRDRIIATYDLHTTDTAPEALAAAIALEQSVDAIFPNAGGRFELTREDCADPGRAPRRHARAPRRTMDATGAAVPRAGTVVRSGSRARRIARFAGEGS